MKTQKIRNYFSSSFLYSYKIVLSFGFLVHFLGLGLSLPKAHAGEQCHSYFVQTDLFESFTEEEKINILILAEKYIDSKQRTHDTTVDIKILIDTNLKKIIKDKKWNVSQSKNFSTLFLNLVHELQERREERDHNFTQQEVLSQRLLLQQKSEQQWQLKYKRLLTKHMAEDFEDLVHKILKTYETTDLHEAFLKSCGKIWKGTYFPDLLEIEYLFHLQENANKVDTSGNNALFYASPHIGSEGVLQFLINSGMDLNNSSGKKSSLAYAIQYQQFKTFRLLLEAGADRDILDESQSSPLMRVMDHNNNRAIRMAQLLIDAGVKMNAQNDMGNTALMIAIYNRQSKMARMLFDKGADASIANHKGFTPFTMAALQDLPEILRLLLDTGIDINQENSRTGFTALMYAASTVSFNSVQALLAANANPALKNKQGKTALALVRKAKYSRIPKDRLKGPYPFTQWYEDKLKIIQLLEKVTPVEPSLFNTLWKNLLKKK